MTVLDCQAAPDRRSLTGDSPRDREALCDLLAGLYAEQIRLLPENVYLPIHAAEAFIRDQVRNFEWYTRSLPEAGAVLDWGCNHAPDSCLLRAQFGDRYQLHGCDFKPTGHYAAFHGYAGLAYRQVTDPLVLPYESNTFDAIIG